MKSEILYNISIAEGSHYLKKKSSLNMGIAQIG
jgi:hypothetical protein